MWQTGHSSAAGSFDRKQDPSPNVQSTPRTPPSCRFNRCGAGAEPVQRVLPQQFQSRTMVLYPTAQLGRTVGGALARSAIDSSAATPPRMMLSRMVG